MASQVLRIGPSWWPTWLVVGVLLLAMPARAQDRAEAEDAPVAAPEGAALEAAEAAEPAAIHYTLEGVELRGNDATHDAVLLRHVPYRAGDILAVEDPGLEAVRFRLIGTGLFDDVRLWLRRGSARGMVVLVIEVKERNTIVVEQLSFGISRGVGNSGDLSSDVLPYVGLTLSERSLFGTGVALSASGFISERQQGGRLRLNDPLFLGSRFGLSLAAFMYNGREFFGREPLVAVRCPPTLTDPCPAEVAARRAVVFYRRWGVALGSSLDIGASTWLTADWQPELLSVWLRPDAASDLIGTEIEPIDFTVRAGTSYLSTLRFGLHHDTRNDPALPTDGFVARFLADVSSPVLGSDFLFMRLQLLLRSWFELPYAKGHSLRLSFYGGAIFGDPPFFYKFFPSDLSDLIPSRVLEMNVDDRAPANLLGSSIVEMRAQDLAARLDLEYSVNLYRGGASLRSINTYLGGGLYILGDSEHFRVGIPGYDGFARLPLDLTFDLGVRFDTSIGLFQLGLSTLFGFVVL